jgi:dihydrofolate reductase
MKPRRIFPRRWRYDPHAYAQSYPRSYREGDSHWFGFLSGSGRVNLCVGIMRRLTSIVAVNQEGIIGAGNALPWRIKTDLKFFRDQTIDNVVIMGRKTYDSLGVPLKGRLNIVVTHGFGLFNQSKSCLVAHSIDEAIAIAELKRLRRQEVFVIGGATMYEQFVPYVDRYLITDVDKVVDNGDTYFSKEIFNPIENWKIDLKSEGFPNSDGDEAAFKTYELNAKSSTTYESRRKLAIDAFLNRSHMRSAKAMRSAFIEEARLSA